MQAVDEIRGFDRHILFSATGGYATSGFVPLTNCVVEVKEIDTDGRCPVLSLRFYHKPTYPHQIAEECAEGGRPLYDENTEIGVAIDLGIEMAQSLMTQLQTKWQEFVHVVQDVEQPPTEG
jgi:hypothetical protein